MRLRMANTPESQAVGNGCTSGGKSIVGTKKKSYLCTAIQMSRYLRLTAVITYDNGRS